MSFRYQGPLASGVWYKLGGVQRGVVLAAHWATYTTGDYESLRSRSIYDLVQMLPEDDPILRFFGLTNESGDEGGTITPPEALALAARLAEVAYQLHESRRAHDDCADMAFWLLRECAVAAARRESITWS